MGQLKDVVEPSVIALLFTAGALINRRSRQPARDIETHRPDNARFRNNIASRFLDAFPFLLEIWYWNLTYWLYQLARAFSAYCIRDKPSIQLQAQHHALSILALEHHLGLDIELPLQNLIQTSFPALMPCLAAIYYSHITVGVLFIVYTYTYFPPPTFQRVRRSIALNNILAFILLSFYRCTPPRLLPKAQYGFTDSLHATSSSNAVWSHNRFQLTLAAMPSLHFGTASFLAFALSNFAPHRPLRILAPLWPVLMAITVLATANHWVMDLLVGVLVVMGGWRFNAVLLHLRPLEEWGLRMLGLRRPREGGGEGKGWGV